MLFQPLRRRVEQQACCVGHFGFDTHQTGVEIRARLPDRQQIARLGVEQEQQAVQEAENAAENSVQPLLGELRGASLPLANSGDETLGKNGEDLIEDPLFEALA